MMPRMVWKEEGAPPLEVEIVDPSDFRQKEPAHRVLFVRTVLPFKPETLESAFLRMTAARMFRQLTDLLPFVEFHVKRIYPDFRPSPSSTTEGSSQSASSTRELLEAYRFKSLDEIPENLRCYSGEGVGSQSVIEGLFVASGESFPHYGSMGAMIAALESVAWIAHRCGLPGPFLTMAAK